MAANSSRNCLHWLKQNYSANVTQEWLDACIEFIKQENNGKFLSQNQLNQLVYEQFLLADLQEMSTGSLPAITTEQDIMTIQGKHCLQINSLINVGQSAYSQIQKMNGKDDPDSLQDNKTNNWEPKVKPSRMLFLQLSDGAKQIQAMEYQPIPCLQASTSPGTKIQIEGPIMCRLGVMLLAEKNVRLLGGACDELVETSSMWKVLHTSIGQDPPEEPNSIEIPDEPPNTQADNTQNVVGNASGTSSKRNSTENRTNDSKTWTSRNLQVGNSQMNRNSQQASCSNNNGNKSWTSVGRGVGKNSGQTASRGHFGDGQAQMNKQQSKQNRTQTQTSSSNDGNKSWTTVGGSMGKRSGQMVAGGNIGVGQAQMNIQQPKQNRTQTRNFNNNSTTFQTKQAGIGSYFTGSKQEQNQEQALEDYFNDDEDEDLFYGDDIEENIDFDQLDQLAQRLSNTNSKPSGHSTYQQSNSLNVGFGTEADDDELQEIMDNFDDGDDDLCDFDIPELNNNVPKQQDPRTSIASSSKEPLPGKSGPRNTGMTGSFGFGKYDHGTDKGTSKTTFKSEPSCSGISGAASLTKKIKLSNGKTGTSKTGMESCRIGTEEFGDSGMDFSPSERVRASATGMCRTKQVSSNSVNENRERTNITKEKSALTGLGIGSGVGREGLRIKQEMTSLADGAASDGCTRESMPFTYLDRVLKKMPFAEEITLRIKAYISTLVSHAQVPGSGWCVTVKVNDGTATMDMDLGPEVLSELLQCPVESFQILMQQAKKSPNPEVRQSLQQRTQQFQRSLSMVSGLMDVLFTSARPRPLIIRLREPSRDDIKMLLLRIRNS